jgi:thiamine-phosphate pyrophosphorylase
MNRQLDLSLYLVLDPELCRPHTMIETARQAVAGGATVVQVRLKRASTAERVALARGVREVLRDTPARIVMNDDVEAAVQAGVDALHVGQRDMAVTAARERIGREMLLGVSVNSENVVGALDFDVVDYVGVGPVFATPTKPDHERPIGMDGLARIVAACPVPAVAIGGLKKQHVADVLATGARGLAVVSAICGTPDPQQAAAELRACIRQCRGDA